MWDAGLIQEIRTRAVNCDNEGDEDIIQIVRQRCASYHFISDWLQVLFALCSTAGTEEIFLPAAIKIVKVSEGQ